MNSQNSSFFQIARDAYDEKDYKKSLIFIMIYLKLHPNHFEG